MEVWDRDKRVRVRDMVRVRDRVRFRVCRLVSATIIINPVIITV